MSAPFLVDFDAVRPVRAKRLRKYRCRHLIRFGSHKSVVTILNFLDIAPNSIVVAMAQAIASYRAIRYLTNHIHLWFECTVDPLMIFTSKSCRVPRFCFLETINALEGNQCHQLRIPSMLFTVIGDHHDLVILRTQTMNQKLGASCKIL